MVFSAPFSLPGSSRFEEYNQEVKAVLAKLLKAYFHSDREAWNRVVSCRPRVVLTPHPRQAWGTWRGWGRSDPSCGGLGTLLPDSPPPAPALEAGCQPGALLSQGVVGLEGERIQQADREKQVLRGQKPSTKAGRQVVVGLGRRGEWGGAGKAGNAPNTHLTTRQRWTLLPCV